ncbi:GNAT family N-acetyltransferase [Photobacterium sp. BZF1]|uniref:GNAT family N-acetyltransferase n=1 Tax=Photobacterium sp. BZF1 TaxID=1904457 RepID=UPI001653B38A|nr:GNAT family N-acetyltransferase [Photobacterium sp. BZF1]MBC7003277.1 GNAT family N-acetyltransferase [Photobacterium sp. BZF1]
MDKSRRFIRTATINDLLALKRLFIVENHHNAAIAPDVISQTEDVLTEEELREIIADNNQCLLVVDVDGNVVGTLLGSVVDVAGRRWTNSRCYGYIEELVVDEHQRGKGFARQLMATFEGWAKNKGAASVDLHVWSNNQTANEFYHRYGFSEKQRLLSKSL